MEYQNYEALQIERDSGILRVTINRPEARNAINPQLHEEFSRIFSDAERDRETDVVILTGAGDAFCAGGDLNWLLDMHGKPAEQYETIRNDRMIQNTMLDLEKPIIARVVGPAVGLGCSLALYCDFVYATPKARFADPHVSVGLVAGDGGAVIWPQLIGYARAKRYLLTGDPITGVEAEKLGLITEAVEEDQLDATVDAMAQRMIDGAKHAIRWTKASINAGLKQVANAVLDRAAAYEAMSQTLEDHRIALEAFQNRETPKFLGK
ncbi:enoyl-CoA hydratase/isomerase family protein [Myxococcota bacterium]|nr:enoyl-CoA hydratase/isomerase family protein [Myxococcota bacterium]